MRFFNDSLAKILAESRCTYMYIYTYLYIYIYRPYIYRHIYTDIYLSYGSKGIGMRLFNDSLAKILAESRCTYMYIYTYLYIYIYI